LIVGLVGVVGACEEDSGGGEQKQKIVIAGPQSETGKYASAGKQAIAGMDAMVAWVNDVNGGVSYDGRRIPLEFRHVDDASDEAEVQRIMLELCEDPEVDFLFAPYSSGLAAAAAPIA
jgi:branched-chain amino acid transport system substrate-binding protein